MANPVFDHRALSGRKLQKPLLNSNIRRLILETLSNSGTAEQSNEVVFSSDISEAVEPTGTLSGKRRDLTTSKRMRNDIVERTQERDEAWSDAEAVLGKACNVVAERDEALERVTEMEQIRSHTVAVAELKARILTVFDEFEVEMVPVGEMRDAMSAVFAVEHYNEPEEIKKEILR